MLEFFKRLIELLTGKRREPPSTSTTWPEPAPVPPEPEIVPEPPVAAVTPQQKLAACIAAACLVAAPLATKWEGYAPKVYRDPANIPTYCYGETENVNAAKIYSKSECGALLRTRMARDYAPKIAACAPEIIDNRFVFGALVDASYNAGWSAVCKSRMVLSFKAGKLRDGCSGFVDWYVTAKDRKTGQRILLRGLVSRRLEEKAVCLQGVTS